MTARELAAEVLRRGREEHVFASDALEELIADSPQERRLATQLAYGTTRRVATLDAILRPFVRQPLFQLEPEVLDVLRLGAYQLVLLDGIPPHAAVHETVELVRFVGKPQASGLINGVLRRVAELVTDDVTGDLRADTVPLDSPYSPPSLLGKGAGGSGGFQRNLTPQPPSLRGKGEKFLFRRLNQSILPDPVTNPIGYIATGFSWPRWLAERWFDRFGFNECCRLGFLFNAPPPLWLRVNALKTTRDAFRTHLSDAVPGEAPQSLRVPGGSIRDLPGYADGAFAVHDHSSQLVATALRPQPGGSVLDLCAAPGGKTTHLAELMQNRGRIVACDIDESRLKTVTTLAQRLGHTIIETVLMAEDGLPPPGPFDAALVDAPCSNTGVLGRRPEVRWRIQPNEFEYLIRLQTRLLLAAISRVKPGGTIVYSTCSIEHDENRGVIDAVLRGHRGLTVEDEATAIPGEPSDGGYWARLRKM